MTSIEPSAEDDTAAGTTLSRATSWITASDHRSIGRLYLVGGLLGLMATVAVNVVVSIERIDGTDSVFDESSWAQLFDAQRVGLVFGTLLPLAMGLCIAVVPLQLGARSLAFPRLAMSGMWMWLGGLILNVIALANDGGSGGLTSDMVDLYIASIGLMTVGLVASAGAVVTSVLTTRAPGMSMRRVPFFSWSAMVFGLGLVLMLPVLVGTLTYLFVDHRYGSREAFGGNFGTLTWAGWVFTQPATFLFALPAIGVFAHLIPSMFGKRTPARGVMFGGLSLVGVAALAGITQQNIQSLPWPGDSGSIDEDKFRDLVPYTLFNLLPVIGMTIVFLMVMVIAKPQKGSRPTMSPGFGLAFFGFGMVLTGMLGNVLYAVDDLGLQGTVFDEATLVFVAYGGALGIMGGIAHWSPKWRGGVMSAGALLPLGLLGVLGTILAGFPHYVAGFLDQPAGFAYDDSDLQIWNILVLVGHALFGLTVVAFALLVMRVSPGDDDADDPWEGQTAEWLTASPAPADNFDDLVLLGSAEPALDRRERQLEGSDA